MTEQQINSMIVRSLPWAYKIPDPGRFDAMTTSKRPFDGFGVCPGGRGVFFYETKLLKGYQAFAFNRVEPHQWSNLLALADAGQTTVIILAIHNGRGSDLFLLDVRWLNDLRQTTKKSITKKELEQYRAMGLAMESKGGLFPIDLSKTIRSLP